MSKSLAALLGAFALLIPQAAYACRVHVNAEQRAKDEAAWREHDLRMADVIVEGAMLSPDPACSSVAKDCPKRILATRTLKGVQKAIYVLDPNDIWVNCSPSLSDIGDRGTFFLTEADEGYAQLRGEKGNH